MHADLESTIASYLDSPQEDVSALKVATVYFENDFTLAGALALCEQNHLAFIFIVRLLNSCNALGLTLKEISGELNTDITEDILEEWKDAYLF